MKRRALSLIMSGLKGRSQQNSTSTQHPAGNTRSSLSSTSSMIMSATGQATDVSVSRTRHPRFFVLTRNASRQGPMR